MLYDIVESLILKVYVHEIQNIYYIKHDKNTYNCLSRINKEMVTFNVLSGSYEWMSYNLEKNQYTFLLGHPKKCSEYSLGLLTQVSSI